MHQFSVIILKADRICAETLRQRVLTVHPHANCVVAHRMTQARDVLGRNPVDLFVSGIGIDDGDSLDLLARFVKDPRRRGAALVVTGRAEPRLLGTLLGMPVNGIFDSSNDAPENVISALRKIAGGCGYWSPSIKRMLPQRNRVQQQLQLLTPTEQLVFVIIGDGSDDTTAGEQLGMKPASVQAVRRSLHRKLCIKHKGELVSIAAQYGFVRFTPTGVIRIGLGLLLAQYYARSKRPLALSTKFAAKYPDVAEAIAQRRRKAPVEMNDSIRPSFRVNPRCSTDQRLR